MKNGTLQGIIIAGYLDIGIFTKEKTSQHIHIQINNVHYRSTMDLWEISYNYMVDCIYIYLMMVDLHIRL